MIIIPLSKQDRCDHPGCAAEGRVRVMLARLDLVFCGHHFRRHEGNLFLAGFTVNDDTRDELTARPADVEGH